MNIQIFEEPNLRIWEGLIRSYSATPFFYPSWLESFRNKNRIPIYLRFSLEGKTIGIIAGLKIEPPNVLLKKFFRILFFYSGPAVDNSEKSLARMCLTKLVSFSRESRYTHLRVRSYDYPYSLNFDGLPFTPSARNEYILDLRPSLEDLKRKMKKRMTEVRNAEKNGLLFLESSSVSIVDNLLPLLEETKSIRLLKNYENYSYFYIPWLDKTILYKLVENKAVRIFYVRKHDEILSVSAELVSDKKAYGLFIGTSQAGYKLKANTLINFKVIEKLKSEGVELYNFGGVVASDSSSKGLAFYKSSFGAKEHVCIGGYTQHLQSSFLNNLTRVYSKFPELKVKKIIQQIFLGQQ